MKLEYPEDAIQAYVDRWWEPAPASGGLRRGTLISCTIPHIAQVGTELEIVGPAGRRRPNAVEALVKPLDRGQPIAQPDPPSAALYTREDERWGLYKVKERPAILVADLPPEVDPNSLPEGSELPHVAPTLLVAPAYGIGGEAGFPSALADRARRGQYPQYIWDLFPLADGPREVIVRLDQIQAVGRSPQHFVQTPWRLSDEALEVFEDWLTWMRTGTLDPDGTLKTVQDMLRELE